MENIMNKPIGHVDLIFHDGGKINKKTNKIENGKIIKIIGDNNRIVESAANVLANCMANKGYLMRFIRFYYKTNINNKEIRQVDINLDEPYLINSEGIMSDLSDVNDGIYNVKGVGFSATIDMFQAGYVITKVEMYGGPSDKYILFSEKEVALWSLPPSTFVTALWKITF